MNEPVVTLDHGSGGRKTAELIRELMLPAFDNPALSALGDGAALDLAGPLVFSTDSFVVQPLFFPGGDIGKLAVCGTVNDLAMCGGIPRCLSLGMILEEGFPLSDLERIVASVARTAREAEVQIVTGDTKVVERGRGDGVYLNTSGIGTLACPGLTPDAIRPGDRVLISGALGDHGAAVMMARNGFAGGDALRSDCRPLHRLARAAWEAGGVRVLRDPTRGGVATTLNEFTEGPSLSSWRRMPSPSIRRSARPATCSGWTRSTAQTRASSSPSAPRSGRRRCWLPCARSPAGRRRRRSAG